MCCYLVSKLFQILWKCAPSDVKGTIEPFVRYDIFGSSISQGCRSRNCHISQTTITRFISSFTHLDYNRLNTIFGVTSSVGPAFDPSKLWSAFAHASLRSIYFRVQHPTLHIHSKGAIGT
jgi:hypothetical protein